MKIRKKQPKEKETNNLSEKNKEDGKNHDLMLLVLGLFRVAKSEKEIVETLVPILVDDLKSDKTILTKAIKRVYKKVGKLDLSSIEI